VDYFFNVDGRNSRGMLVCKEKLSRRLINLKNNNAMRLQTALIKDNVIKSHRAIEPGLLIA
jgi:hypothetical protein